MAAVNKATAATLKSQRNASNNFPRITVDQNLNAASQGFVTCESNKGLFSTVVPRNPFKN